MRCGRMIRGLQRYYFCQLSVYTIAMSEKNSYEFEYHREYHEHLRVLFLVLVDAHRIKLSKTQNNLYGSHSAGRSETRCVFVSRRS